VGGTLYLGTSGFAYPEWKGSFYPEDLRPKDFLPYYAATFRSVEINYTFRRQPAPTTLRTWREATPDGFLFTLKAHQRITHVLRLADADGAVSSFLDRAALLGPRLGPILFQCPPSLRHDRSLIESFLAFLPPTLRYAFEFRHPSWAAARDVLAAQGATWCVAETDQRSAAGEPLDGPFVYLRLRKERYDDDALRGWATRIVDALARGRDVFCYFKHEEGGAGPALARRLAAMVEPGELG
jgi:uncharacterized protein YecE (DUF72 family)